MTGPLADADAVAQAELVRTGEATPRELVQAAIDRIETTDAEINAITHRRYERALAEADGTRAGAPFAGVPMLVKALNDSEGDPANHGSAWVPRTGRTAVAHSTINRRLVEAGFVIVGQTSAPEFGVLSVSESAVHGITRNPWRTDLTPGGSSGGASAAVAAGMVPAAQGGDGGGSIRMPAAFCHLVGLKPTVGRISSGPGRLDLWGHSVPSVLTRTVRDTAAVLDAVAGPAPGDRGVPLPPPEGGWAQAARRDPGSLRIGVLDRAPEHAPQVAPVVADSVREISGVELADALTWQGGLRARMATWWGSGFDLLLSPVFATPPKPVSWPWKEPDGVRLSVDVLTFTAPFNTTGQPAISVPATITDAGEPIGVQLVAACGREDLLLAVAAQIEAERPWAGLRPPVFAA